MAIQQGLKDSYFICQMHQKFGDDPDKFPVVTFSCIHHGAKINIKLTFDSKVKHTISNPVKDCGQHYGGRKLGSKCTCGVISMTTALSRLLQSMHGTKH